MTNECSFIDRLPEGAKQSLSGALNHIMIQSDHNLTAEAGSDILTDNIPEEEQKALSVAVYQVVRNHRIRMQFHHLRQQGMNVEQACRALEKKLNLHHNTIRNIAYRK